MTTLSKPIEEVRVLFIDAGQEPIHTEKLVMTDENPALVHKTILEGLNRLGHRTTALIHFRSKWFEAVHTADRGKSSNYYKNQIFYHPYMVNLA